VARVGHGTLGPEVGEQFVPGEPALSGGGQQGEERETAMLGRHRRPSCVHQSQTTKGLKPHDEHQMRAR